MSKQRNQHFHDTVSALAYTLAGAARSASSADLDPPFNDITRFILDQHQRMPDYLRGLVEMAARGLDLGALLSGGSFHRLPPQARAKIITAWKASPRAWRRDLIRLFESLAVYALYCRVSEPAASPVLDGSPFDNLPNIHNEIAGGQMRCRIAVIGSGPSGMLTACMLAERGRDVILVEEGPCLPAGRPAPFSRDELEQRFRNGGVMPVFGTSRINLLEARCVGGGGELGLGSWQRPQDAVIDDWAKTWRVDAMSPDQIRPHLEACERELGLADSQGPRPSLTAVLLPRFLKARGQLLPDTRVETLRRESGRWTLMSRHARQGRVKLSADAVIVCAGAVQTAALLLRSGLLKKNTPSLCLQPAIKVVARFPAGIRPGQVLSSGAQPGQRHFIEPCAGTLPHLALGLLEHRDALSRLMEQRSRLAVFRARIIPEARGTVRNLPDCRDPLVRLKLTPGDHRLLADATRALAGALLSAGAEAVYPAFRGAPEITAVSGLSALPESMPMGAATLFSHCSSGTCPMGGDAGICPADSFGELRGVGGLFVNDSSLLGLPPVPGSQALVMAVARRNVLNSIGES
jgi:choline dehydrogenase-like flavoprotein